MANSMENYNNISCDIGQGKTISVPDTRQDKWRITIISLLTLEKINLSGIQYGG